MVDLTSRQLWGLLIGLNLVVFAILFLPELAAAQPPFDVPPGPPDPTPPFNLPPGPPFDPPGPPPPFNLPPGPPSF